MTMVEIMARAIALSFGDDYGSIPADKREWTARRGDFEGRFRDVNEAYRCDYDDMAIAALRVMREPTTEMYEAFRLASENHITPFYVGWQAAIDAAIAETK